MEITEDEAVAIDLQALADEVAEKVPEVSDADPVPQPGAFSEAPESPDVSDRIIEELEHELEEATKRLHEAEKRETEHLDKHHRLLADFHNYRNRTTREIQMGVDQAEKKLLTELLPVLDSFERCVGASYQGLDDFRSGVALIQKQFLDALRRLGVEPVQVGVGDPFDATHAEALTTSADPALPDGSVSAVYERGFMLRDQLLRPARVVVNHHPDGHDGTPAAPPEATA